MQINYKMNFIKDSFERFYEHFNPNKAGLFEVSFL